MPRVTVVLDNSRIIEGFLLSRQVMDCSPRTLQDYQSRLGQFVRFLSEQFDGVRLQDTQRIHVESYLVDLRNKGRAAWTLKTQHRALRAFFRWMIENQFIEASPLEHIKQAKTPKVGKPFITEKERDRLLSICVVNTFIGARSFAMIWLLWSTGMRFSELVNLNRSDLEDSKNRIRIMGKGRKERYVPYTKEAKTSVWRYLIYRKDDLPQLWLSEERTPLEGRGVREAIKRVYERADLKVKDNFHIFRRSWAMRNLKAGVPVRYVQIVGGWENLSTMEIYVRAMQSDEALGAKWV